MAAQKKKHEAERKKIKKINKLIIDTDGNRRKKKEKR